MPDDEKARVPFTLPLSVFLVSVAVLAYEIALTRCFSVLLRYHFVFLIVSIATFGLGIGGLVDYLLLRRFSGGELGRLAWIATLLAPLPALSVLVLFHAPVSHHLSQLWLVAGVSAPPFLVAGVFLSLIWRSFTGLGGRLYAADLGGAAVGSVAVIAALQLFGGTGTPMAAGVVVGLAAVGLAWQAGGPASRALSCVATFVPALLVVANFATGFADLPAVPVTHDRTVKTLYQELGDPQQGAKIVYSEWNAFARTDVVRYHPPGQPRPWPDLYVYTDGDVPTNMKPFDGDMRKVLPDLEWFIGFLPFRLQRPEKVLLIGPGGGLDILLAFAAGAKEIDGAELNPSIPRIVRRFAGLNGHVYEYSNVHIAVAEGRSYLRRSHKQYDMIYMALTYAATTPGTSGLALVESYLHTVEAWRACLERLSPGGQVVFVCGEERLLLRAFLTALEALKQDGVPHDEALRSLAVVDVWPAQYGEGPYRHMLVVRRKPFSAAESRQLGETAMAMGLVPGFCPGAYEPAPFSLLVNGGSAADLDRLLNDSFAGGAKTTVRPVTDDSPFFADLTVGVPAGFGRFLVGGAVLLACVVAATCITHALRRRARPPQRPAESPAGDMPVETESGIHAGNRYSGSLVASERLIPTQWAAEKAVYFAGIGLGFMLVEVCLAQKLILYVGYPTLALAVILFALLLGGGLGSLFSQSWSSRWLACGAAIAATAVAALVLGLGRMHGLDRIFGTTLAWPILARTVTAAAVLLPLGFALGTQFPSGIRRLRGPNAALAPWMWATNGTASVLGSVGAMCAAKVWGFHTVLLLGAACYAVVALLSGLEHVTLERQAESGTQDVDHRP
jgi:predicted membrane-bound spermidine synthase